MGESHRPQGVGSLKEQHQRDADHGCRNDSSETSPPMIASEQERRGYDRGITVAKMGLEYMARAASKNDLLAAGHQRHAEDEIDEIEPAAWPKIHPKDCRWKRGVDARTHPPAKTDAEQYNTDDPQGDLPKGHSTFAPLECDCSRGRNRDKHCQSAKPPGVIPKNPTSRIVLIQAHDLGRYHWNENGYEPGRDNHRLSPSAPVEFSSRHHKEFPPVRLFGNVKVVHHATETTIKVSGSFWVTAKSQV